MSFLSWHLKDWHILKFVFIRTALNVLIGMLSGVAKDHGTGPRGCFITCWMSKSLSWEAGEVVLIDFFVLLSPSHLSLMFLPLLLTAGVRMFLSCFLLWEHGYSLTSQRILSIWKSLKNVSPPYSIGVMYLATRGIPKELCALKAFDFSNFLSTVLLWFHLHKF